MSLHLDLDPTLEARLRDEAERLGIDVSSFTQALLQDFLAQPDDEVIDLTEKILKKNAELYRRLA